MSKYTYFNLVFPTGNLKTGIFTETEMKYSQDKARHTLHVNFPEQKKSSSFEQTLIFRRIAQELPVWKKTLQNIVSFQTIPLDKTIVSDNQKSIT